ncbi:MAG: twin-arginine translocase TatA/TatE family subunit [Spirochaetales bacterium]|nr:twin-arginine translocase TatA/TatE family subunit [Spirochaetales bacterium]
MIGLGEILIFGGVLVLIFGATQIPKIAKSLGEGLKEFKKSVKEAKEMDEEENQEEKKPKEEK